MVDIFAPLAAITGGNATVFNTNKDISTATLNKQLQNNFQKRVETEVQRIEQSFSSELNSQDWEENRLAKYRTDLGEALDVMQNTSTRLDGVLQRIDQLIINVRKAEESIADEDVFFKAAGYAATHDSYLRQLDDLIRETRTSENLLSSDSQSVDYPVSLHGAMTKIYGNDLAPHYYIEDADGNKWHPNQDTQVLKVYTDYPHTEGDDAVSMIHEQGLSIDSFSDPSVDFTIGADGSDPTSYSGTLTREGIEILNSWLYEGLDTQDGRDRALEDFYAAKEAVKVELSRYELVTTTLNYYDELAADMLHGVREERIKIQSKAAEEISKKQYEMLDQFQAVQSSLAQALVVKNSYRNLFPGIANDPLTMRLMNIQA